MLFRSAGRGADRMAGLEAELRRPEYGARFQVFSMLWESCWRGRPARAARERLVLVQSRRSGAVWRDVLARGWGGFWRDELDNRRELGLPPFGVLVQIEHLDKAVSDIKASIKSR